MVNTNAITQPMWDGATGFIETFVSTDLGLIATASLGIALTICVLHYITDFISMFNKLISDKDTAALEQVRRDTIIEDNIQEEVNEYNNLSHGVAVASAQGDSARVAIYQSRQAAVVRRGANKLGRLDRLHFFYKGK